MTIKEENSTGPWTVQGDTIFDADGYPIATVIRDGKPWGQWHANAELLAAAWSLREQLAEWEGGGDEC